MKFGKLGLGRISRYLGWFEPKLGVDSFASCVSKRRIVVELGVGEILEINECERAFRRPWHFAR